MSVLIWVAFFFFFGHYAVVRSSYSQVITSWQRQLVQGLKDPFLDEFMMLSMFIKHQKKQLFIILCHLSYKN